MSQWEARRTSEEISSEVLSFFPPPPRTSHFITSNFGLTLQIFTNFFRKFISTKMSGYQKLQRNETILPQGSTTPPQSWSAHVPRQQSTGNVSSSLPTSGTRTLNRGTKRPSTGEPLMVDEFPLPQELLDNREFWEFMAENIEYQKDIRESHGMDISNLQEISDRIDSELSPYHQREMEGFLSENDDMDLDSDEEWTVANKTPPNYIPQGPITLQRQQTMEVNEPIPRRTTRATNKLEKAIKASQLTCLERCGLTSEDTRQKLPPTTPGSSGSSVFPIDISD